MIEDEKPGFWKHISTDRDNETFDTGRSLVIVVILSMIFMESWDVIWHGTKFDPQSFGTGVAAILVGLGAYVFGDTKNQVPPGQYPGQYGGMPGQYGGRGGFGGQFGGGYGGAYNHPYGVMDRSRGVRRQRDEDSGESEPYRPFSEDGPGEESEEDSQDHQEKSRQLHPRR